MKKYHVQNYVRYKHDMSASLKGYQINHFNITQEMNL